jgi:hypothetical protein
MPRLSGGEMAEGVRRKSAACKESTLRRIGILKRLLSGEKSLRRCVPHFKNFGALCEWDSLEDGITPLSPKTLRSYIATLYNGGYEKFLLDVALATESLRARSKPELSSSSKADRQSRAQAVLLTTQRYSDLLDRVNKLGINSEEVRRALAKHFRLFGDLPSHLRQVK